MKFPTVFPDAKSSVAEFVVPASLLACCTSAIAAFPDVTVKFTPLLGALFTVTTTLPVVAFAGTAIVMLVALHAPAVPADTPLNVTLLVPCEAPKFVPAIVTAAPTGPDVGLRLVMLGGAAPPVAALNAATAAPQLAFAANVAPAETLPAAA